MSLAPSHSVAMCYDSNRPSRGTSVDRLLRDVGRMKAEPNDEEHNALSEDGKVAFRGTGTSRIRRGISIVLQKRFPSAACAVQ